jgi:hypothetical protein
MLLIKDYSSLVVAIISTLTILVVAYLGAWFGRRNEHTKWVREQRLQAYAHWLGVLEEEVTLLDKIYDVRFSIVTADKTRQNIEAEDPAAVRKIAAVIEDLKKFANMNDELHVEAFKTKVRSRTAYNKLQILAGKRMRQKAYEVDKSLSEMIVARRRGGEGDQVEAVWRTRVHEFQDEARKELGLR